MCCMLHFSKFCIYTQKDKRVHCIVVTVNKHLVKHLSNFICLTKEKHIPCLPSCIAKLLQWYIKWQTAWFSNHFLLFSKTKLTSWHAFLSFWIFHFLLPVAMNYLSYLLASCVLLIRLLSCLSVSWPNQLSYYHHQQCVLGFYKGCRPLGNLQCLCRHRFQRQWKVFLCFLF